ncbi:MAG: HigA family addiction module antidote protein [Bacteroidales bacterium]|nr:HigA family addiction module antidote protein [Bacteroidales bacterium]
MADIHLNNIALSADHPGEILKCELEARGLSQKDLAESIGKATPIINDIIKGRRDINVEIAVLLEITLDNISAETWLNWQNAYDLQKIREQEEIRRLQTSISTWNTLKTLVNVNHLKKRLGLGKDIGENVNRVFAFLGVDSTQQLDAKIHSISAYFRKSDNLQTDYVNLMTWMAIVRHRSDELSLANKFSINCINKLTRALNAILYENNNTISRIEQLLANYGIKFIVEKKLEKMPVDGYSFWVGENPTIVMTKRLNRIDNFAFVLFHELGHIVLHLLDSNNRVQDFIETDINTQDEHKNNDYEAAANKFAKDCIWGNIDHKILFGKVTNPYSAGNYLTMISERLKINTGIVVGQYQFYCSEKKLCSNAYAVCYKLTQTIN